jgi:hypothetical protein
MGLARLAEIGLIGEAHEGAIRAGVGDGVALESGRAVVGATHRADAPAARVLDAETRLALLAALTGLAERAVRPRIPAAHFGVLQGHAERVGVAAAAAPHRPAPTGVGLGATADEIRRVRARRDRQCGGHQGEQGRERGSCESSTAHGA